jgi:hypothetical protein
MPYELVLREARQGDEKEVGENVFLDDLQADFPVYLFYYPAAMPDHAFETLLRQFGESTGPNLLVNMGRLNDPNFEKISRAFEIRSFPSVVLTANADLAALRNASISTYVRVDGKILDEADRAIERIQDLYLLFLKGDVAKAIEQAGRQDRADLARRVGKAIVAALTAIGHFVNEHDVTVSVLEGRFEIKKSG